MAEMNMNLLAVALEHTVPAEIEELKQHPLRAVMEAGTPVAEALATQGETMQNATSLTQARTALSRLARAVAMAAFRPEGVRVLGLTFKARHPDQH